MFKMRRWTPLGAANPVSQRLTVVQVTHRMCAKSCWEKPSDLRIFRTREEVMSVGVRLRRNDREPDWCTVCDLQFRLARSRISGRQKAVARVNQRNTFASLSAR